MTQTQDDTHRHAAVVLLCDDLPSLLTALQRDGYKTIGPTVRDGAIVYDELESTDDLPVGWTDEQNGSTYRLKKRDDNSRFGFVVGPQSWKQYLYPPRQTLWSATREDGGFSLQKEPSETPRYAFIGVRACELAAIDIHDRVFARRTYADTQYEHRRAGLFIVAVNCAEAGGTCFCASMDTGPKAARGYDLALTEIIGEGPHRFLVDIGSEAGHRIIKELATQPASESDRSAAEAISARAASQMGRVLDTGNIRELLYRNVESPRLDEVASRCLTCGNCTMVCPTCFCTTVEDTTSLDGSSTERHRLWDWCFSIDFTYLHGGHHIRKSPTARYRQWLTHKFAAWIDQFGVSGCVGCGRCITWCPVGIDVTEEIRAIRALDETGARTSVSVEEIQYGNA